MSCHVEAGHARVATPARNGGESASGRFPLGSKFDCCATRTCRTPHLQQMLKRLQAPEGLRGA